MKSYKKLEQVFLRRSRLAHLSAIMGWDQAVMMPSGGSEARAKSMAELYVMMSELLEKPELADWFEQAEEEVSDLSDWQKANLREMRRMWKNSNAMSVELVEAKTLAGARCEQAWRELRKQNNFRDFLPLLDDVIRITREESQARGEHSGLHPYDAMMELYQPGFDSAAVTKIFALLKSELPPLVQQITEKQKSQTIQQPKGPFAIEKQKALCLEMMKLVGFDFAHGRLDVSTHPFCGGVPQDVRLTTRYNTDEFVESLMGVLHETGHARYEQCLPAEWLEQPVGDARGMTIHESQSLFFEMQVGRSREFLSLVAPTIARHLKAESDGEQAWSAENLFRIYTRVVPGYIRVNADEVTYPMHVILRFELEQALMSGDLKTKDLPGAWDEKMKKYLGLSTAGNDRDGCMQDIHWTDGSFGYFPSYTLGALFAAQLFATVEAQNPHVRADIGRGELKGVLGFLEEKVWNLGRLLETSDLIESATGQALSAEAFLKHLRRRYLD